MVKNKRLISRFGLSTLAAGLSAGVLGMLVGSVQPTQAALIEAGKGPQLLIGRDDDRVDNVAIQVGAAANQSLDRTDVIQGGPGNDVIFGLNGDDVIDGGPGDDNEAVMGGPGIDALIFGATDRNVAADPSTGVRLPSLTEGVLGFPQGIPTANVSGLTNFCTIESSPSPGYDFVVRFHNAAGAILITERVSQVEQVFCSQGGGIVFADLTVASPVFVPVTQQNVETLNPLVAAIIR